MSRLALYRKWRPMTFTDVVEQDHVVRTLKNAIQKDAVGHAYLFCGTRGTGKTTLAKIFSRAINCLAPQEGNPCNECSVCKAILEGSLLDVIEMDAASNNGVDDIRDIREEVIYAPAIAKYKVYIIDEVHMLSTGAFNALLKTLEEPPDRVVFILATTDPQKLPATVLSRCQRFDFKRITDAGIAARLDEIAKESGISVTDPALLLLAKLSGGALRDAISLLDQLTTLGLEKIDVPEVYEMAGFASNEHIRELTIALMDGHTAAAWTVLDTLLREGRDLSQLCQQLLSWYRNVLIIKLSGASSPLVDIHPSDLDTAQSMADALSIEDLGQWLQLLAAHDLALRRTDNPRTLMEVLLLRLCMRTTGSAGVQETLRMAQPIQNSQNRDRTDAFQNRNATAGRNDADTSGMDGFSGASGFREETMPQSHASGFKEEPMHQSRASGFKEEPMSQSRASGFKENQVPPNGSSENPFETDAFAGKSFEAQNGNDTIAAGITEKKNPGAMQRSNANAGSSLALAMDPYPQWRHIIEEIHRSGSQKPGGMKLYAYILDTQCVQTGETQLTIVTGSDDFLKKRILSQPDSVKMITEAALAMTGKNWTLKVESAMPKKPSQPQTASNMAALTTQEPDEKTGNAALDALLSYGRESGIPITIKE